MLTHLLNIVYGIVFGVANVIPGVSGGTMMVVFGVYDKMVDVLTLKLSAIKKNIKFIIFFGIGAAVGVLGFSFVITWLFDNFPVATNMFFMGLIIGSIPLIYRNMTVGGRKITPTTDRITPRISVSRIIMEKVWFARLRSPSPRIFDTSAVPPVPIIKPIPPSTMINGMIRLIAANGVLPAKLETKSPSTTP